MERRGLYESCVLIERLRGRRPPGGSGGEDGGRRHMSPGEQLQLPLSSSPATPWAGGRQINLFLWLVGSAGSTRLGRATGRGILGEQERRRGREGTVIRVMSMRCGRASQIVYLARGAQRNVCRAEGYA